MNTQVETNPYNRESTADTVIAANNLNDVEPLMEIPDVPTDTSGENTGGALEAFAEQESASIAEQKKKTEEAEAGAAGSFSDYIGSLATEDSVEALTFEAEQEAGVPALEQELNRLNNEMLSEQRALKKETDRLNENAGGGLASGVAAEIRNAQRESYSKQADIAVVQMAAQGRHDSAIKWAQRKAAIMFGEQQRTIDIREKIYNANKDIFDKEDQRLFQKQTNKLNNDLTTARQEFQSLQAAKLDALKMAQTNNAPASVLQAIQNADTPEGVIEAGGQYGSTDLLQRRLLTMQINKIGYDMIKNQAAADAAAADAAMGNLSEKDIKAIDSSPQGKKLQASADLKLKMSSYQSLVEEHGYEMFGADKSVLQNAYKELQLSYKEAANLGALQGPDIEILEAAIKNATPGFWGNVGNMVTFGQGTRNLKANLEQAQTTLNESAQNAAEQLYARNPAYQDSQYVQAIMLPFGDELITQAETAEMDAALGE